MAEHSEVAARAEITAIFRKTLIQFAIHVAMGSAIIGLLLGMAVQFTRDAGVMGWAGAWDMFTHLPPWEWTDLGRLALMTLVGTLLVTPIVTTAFYFAESPRWNR